MHGITETLGFWRASVQNVFHVDSPLDPYDQGEGQSCKLNSFQ